MMFVLIVALIASVGAQEDYPICGSDGITYANQHHFHAEQAKDNTLTLKFIGTCELSYWDDYMCENNGTSWICAWDGVSYQNECYYRFAAQRNSTLKMRHTGACDEYDQWTRVCGSDLKFYALQIFLDEQSIRPDLAERSYRFCEYKRPPPGSEPNPNCGPPIYKKHERTTICGNDLLIYFEQTFKEQQAIRPELQEIPLRSCYYKPFFKE